MDHIQAGVEVTEAVKVDQWNAWGIVSVEGKAITVVLSMSVNGRLINRTVKREIDRKLGFVGTALLAADIRRDDYSLVAHEIGKTAVASHPQVKAILDEVVDFIRTSAAI